jgi:hypothetical protein
MTPSPSLGSLFYALICTEALLWMIQVSRHIYSNQLFYLKNEIDECKLFCSRLKTVPATLGIVCYISYL